MTMTIQVDNSKPTQQSWRLTDLARSELLKLATNPLCLGGIALMVILPIAVAAGSVGADTLGLWHQGMSRGALLGQLGAVVFASAVFGQEFEGASLRTTYLAVPRRSLVLTVKLALTGLIVAGLCVASGLALILARLILAPGVMTGAELRSTGIWIAQFSLTWILMAGVSFGISLILGSSVATIAILVPMMLALSQVIYILTDLARFLPDLAGYRLINDEAFPALLPAPLGAAVQAAWAVTLLAFGWWRTRHRDVR